MSRLPLFAALLGLAACQTTAQMLAAGDAAAIGTAQARARFEMNCPAASGSVLSSRAIEPVALRTALARALPDAKFTVIVPAFVASELKSAFQIGFMIFIPFLVIDMIVASVLMSLGMMMLSPVLVALPFKLMLFVLADGWNLLIGSLAGPARVRRGPPLGSVSGAGFCEGGLVLGLRRKPVYPDLIMHDEHIEGTAYDVPYVTESAENEELRSVAEGAGRLAMAACAVGLRGVFEDEEVVLRGDGRVDLGEGEGLHQLLDLFGGHLLGASGSHRRRGCNDGLWRAEAAVDAGDQQRPLRMLCAQPFQDPVNLGAVTRVIGSRQPVQFTAAAAEVHNHAPPSASRSGADCDGLRLRSASAAALTRGSSAALLTAASAAAKATTATSR